MSNDKENQTEKNKVIEFPGTKSKEDDISRKKHEKREVGEQNEDKTAEKLDKAFRELTEEYKETGEEGSKEKDKKNPFAKRLRQLIKERDIRVTDLAWGTGVAPKTIYSFLNGHAFPSVETLLNISSYLGVSTDYLLGKSEEPTGIALEEGEEYEETLTVRRLYKQLSKRERQIIKTLLESMVKEGKFD